MHALVPLAWQNASWPHVHSPSLDYSTFTASDYTNNHAVATRFGACWTADILHHPHRAGSPLYSTRVSFTGGYGSARLWRRGLSDTSTRDRTKEHTYEVKSSNQPAGHNSTPSWILTSHPHYTISYFLHLHPVGVSHGRGTSLRNAPCETTPAAGNSPYTTAPV